MVRHMNLDELFAKMQEKAKKVSLTEPVSADILLNITGESPKTWLVSLGGGAVSVAEAAPDQKKDVAITVKDEVFLKVAMREMNPMTAFMTGKIKVDGDLQFLGYLKHLFPNGDA